MPPRSRLHPSLLPLRPPQPTQRYNLFPIWEGRGQWKSWKRVRSTLRRPNSKKRAKSPKRKEQNQLTAETRRLWGGSNGLGPHAWSWMATLFHGTRLCRSPNEDRHPIWLRLCSSPSSCPVTWRGSGRLGSQISSCRWKGIWPWWAEIFFSFQLLPIDYFLLINFPLLWCRSLNKFM